MHEHQRACFVSATIALMSRQNVNGLSWQVWPVRSNMLLAALYEALYKAPHALTQHLELHARTSLRELAFKQKASCRTSLASADSSPMQGVPQWLWSPALENVASAVTEAISLQEAIGKIGELPACFSSALLPQVITMHIVR